MPNTILRLTIKDPIAELPALVIDKFAGYERSRISRYSSPEFIASGNMRLSGARHLQTRYIWSVAAQMTNADRYKLEDMVDLMEDRIALYRGDVEDQAARLAMPNVGVGNWVTQLDNGTTYRLTSLPSSTNGNWTPLAGRINGLIVEDEYQSMSSRILGKKAVVSGGTATVGGATVGFGSVLAFISFAESNPIQLIGAGSVDFSSGDISETVQFSITEIPVVAV